MTVQPHMVNGQRIAHGGFIFTLADSAFAFACNSHNEKAVAAQGDITFIKPGKLGDAWSPLRARFRAAVARGFTMCGSLWAMRSSPNSGVIPAPSAAHGFRQTRPVASKNKTF